MTEQQDAASSGSEDSSIVYSDITISTAMELSVVNPGVEGARTVPLALHQTTGRGHVRLYLIANQPSMLN
jgi:hypothetical protein